MTKNSQKLLYIVGGCIALVVAVILVLRLFGYDVFDRSGWKTAENGDILYLDYSGDPLTGWLLVEGLEVPGANAKNCSYAFDKMGYGALVCAGTSILGAWQEREDGDYIAAAKDAAERLKRNLTRYVTIL